jgi:DNA invertase Pin-like site-specific DNA recombinase
VPLSESRGASPENVKASEGRTERSRDFPEVILKSVFIYTRISTAEQAAGNGFERQREKCFEFCESKGWVCYRTFKEKESGSVETANRPVLAECLSLCSSGIEIIVVERADRIARDLIVSELFFRECKGKGISVYAADSGEELVNANSDPTRTLIRQVLGALAEWDKAQIVRKLQDGRRRTKEKTGWPCGGPQVFGRKPGEQKWIWRIVGLHRLGFSISRIADALNYHQKYREEKIRFWHRPTIYDMVLTWSHRGEFSNEKLAELLDTPEGVLTFSETHLRALKEHYGLAS